MATKSENADIAVLQKQMEGVEKDMTEVKTDVKKILENLDDSYVKKDEFKSFKWTTIPITIVVTVVITFLVTFFLQKISENPQASNPTTSNTTTTTTPTGSTSETTTSDTKPTSPQPSPEDQTFNDPPSTDGGVQLELPKLTP